MPTRSLALVLLVLLGVAHPLQADDQALIRQGEEALARSSEARKNLYEKFLPRAEDLGPAWRQPWQLPDGVRTYQAAEDWWTKLYQQRGAAEMGVILSVLRGLPADQVRTMVDKLHTEILAQVRPRDVPKGLRREQAPLAMLITFDDLTFETDLTRYWNRITQVLASTQTGGTQAALLGAVMGELSGKSVPQMKAELIQRVHDLEASTEMVYSRCADWKAWTSGDEKRAAQTPIRHAVVRLFHLAPGATPSGPRMSRAFAETLQGKWNQQLADYRREAIRALVAREPNPRRGLAAELEKKLPSSRFRIEPRALGDDCYVIDLEADLKFPTGALPPTNLNAYLRNGNTVVHVGVGGLGSREAMRKDLDYLLKEMDARTGTRVRLIDENRSVYRLQCEQGVDPAVIPCVRFQLKDLEWEQLGIRLDQLGNTASKQVVLWCDVTVQVEGHQGTVRRKGRRIGFRPFDLSGGPHRRQGRTVEFWRSLHDVLGRCRTEPYTFLARAHFDPSRGDAIPGEGVVTIGLQPIEATLEAGRGEPKTLALRTSRPSSARFTIGGPIELARHTKLIVGTGGPASWSDYSSIAFAVGTKVLPGGKILAILDAGVTLVCVASAAIRGDYGSAAESTVDLGAGLILPAPLDLFFTIPELQRLYETWFGPAPAAVDVSKATLRKLGYEPLSGVRASKQHPIWISMHGGKLALIDGASVIHRVDPPKNLHVSSETLVVERVAPSDQSVQIRTYDGKQSSPWKAISGSVLEDKPLLPPPHPYTPLEIRLPEPVGRQFRQDLAQELVLRVSPSYGSDGEMILSRDEDGEGLIQIGWEDDPVGLVLKKPYVCVLSGLLRVRDVKHRVGIGIYRLDSDTGLRPGDDSRVGAGPHRQPFELELWVRPEGTVYEVSVDPKSGRASVRVIEGRVVLEGRDGRRITEVREGGTHTVNLARAREPRSPAGRYVLDIEAFTEGKLSFLRGRYEREGMSAHVQQRKLREVAEKLRHASGTLVLEADGSCRFDGDFDPAAAGRRGRWTLEAGRLRIAVEPSSERTGVSFKGSFEGPRLHLVAPNPVYGMVFVRQDGEDPPPRPTGLAGVYDLDAGAFERTLGVPGPTRVSMTLRRDGTLLIGGRWVGEDVHLTGAWRPTAIGFTLELTGGDTFYQRETIQGRADAEGVLRWTIPSEEIDLVFRRRGPRVR